MSPPRPRPSRKLLVASIGVATVSYMAATASCSSSSQGAPVGNLVAPPNDASQTGDATQPADSPTGEEFAVGNLVAFPLDAAEGDGAQEGAPQDGSKDVEPNDGELKDVVEDVIDDFSRVVGNLIAPPRDP